MEKFPTHPAMLVGVRSRGVPGFRSHLVFNRVKGETVGALAVFEGRRDLAKVLAKR